MKYAKIGIVGTRRRDSKEAYDKVHDKYLDLCEIELIKPIHIISGGAYHGADRFAVIIAREYGHPITIYFPNWELGMNAGFFRNTLIAKDSEILIACVWHDRTGGTEDTIRKFVKLKGEKNLHIV